MPEQASLPGAEKEFVSDADATAKAYEALRTKLNPRGTMYPAWAIFYEVKSPHGRHADAIAMSAWNSRGHEIWGFEVKASRGDWQKELATPEKAHYFYENTDRWWVIAARPGIVRKDELPPGWGLMELQGDVLRTVVQAARREARLDRAFVAMLLRSAFERSVRSASEEEKRAEYAKGREYGALEGKADCARTHDKDARDVVNARGVLDAFLKHTGIHLESWNVEKVGRIIRALYNAEDRAETAVHALERLAQQGRDLQRIAEEEAAKLRRQRA